MRYTASLASPTARAHKNRTGTRVDACVARPTSLDQRHGDHLAALVGTGEDIACGDLGELLRKHVWTVDRLLPRGSPIWVTTTSMT